jgi:hypothetical protein
MLHRLVNTRMQPYNFRCVLANTFFYAVRVHVFSAL